VFDRKTLNRKVWLQLVGHASCTVPVVLAAGALACGTVVQDGGMFFFAGIVSFLVGLGAIGVRTVYKYEDIANNIQKNVEKQRNQEQEDKLDLLHQRLERDNDPRDERLLIDLRKLLSGFHPEKSWMKSLERGTFAQVVVQVQTLFDECIVTLENIADLRDMIVDLSREAAKGLKKDREDKILQVASGVEKLGEILTEVQQLGGRQLSGRISAGVDITDTADSLLNALRATTKAEEELRTPYTRKYDQFGNIVKSTEEAEVAPEVETTGRKHAKPERL